MNFLEIDRISIYSFDQKEYYISSLKLFSEYFSEYFHGEYKSLDLFIEDCGSIVGCVNAAIYKNSLCLPDGGIKLVFFNPNLAFDKNLIKEVIEKLFNLAQSRGCNHICISDHLVEGELSVLGEALLNKKFSHNHNFMMTIDLGEFSISEYRKKIRKSYKSLINWGEKNLEIIRLNAFNGDEQQLQEFQDFHCKISGRKTRSDRTWQYQYDMVKSGIAEMTLAYLDKTLVAATFFADYVDTAVYFSGVYERELFDYGVSHYMVYDGICQSKVRGHCSKLSLGGFDTHQSDPKAYNIQFFKKGFSEKVESVMYWQKEI